jgi:rod shape-determining protein MreC
VGIVDAVSAHHSYALSFQNTDISISGRFGEDGATGLLVWDGKSSHGAILQEVPLQYKYAVGDTVYTSGHSLMFPPDIPLGVAGEARVINGATNEIQVDLFQDFTAIRYVTVVHNASLEEVEGFDL